MLLPGHADVKLAGAELYAINVCEGEVDKRTGRKWREDMQWEEGERER